MKEIPEMAEAYGRDIGKERGHTKVGSMTSSPSGLVCKYRRAIKSMKLNADRNSIDETCDQILLSG